ncbi:MAG TPA: hypothetical protein VFQ79_18695 [Bryobacteraceae bacterium]|nr:hypothetical protein [Bryobacteraceae bacterium]
MHAQKFLPDMTITRRNLMLPAAAAVFAQTGEPSWLRQVIDRHDSHVEHLLKQQITSPRDRWRGIFPDEYGLYFPAAAAGIIDAMAAAYLHPGSKFHKNAELPRRIQLAADLLAREQTSDGNWDLPITNFNSPPDTGFILRNLCPPAVLLKRAQETELFGQLEPLLRKAGGGISKGGVHTPNHRWVICAALSQLYELFEEPGYLKRIDQWLAEGIDIDPDGQFSERSTYVYNPVTDNALTTMAAKLNRPHLLEPVRNNLESMLYLLHPEHEVVTEISRRQDRNQRGDMGPYWFSLAYLARHHDNRDGRFETLAAHFAPTRASLSALMEYPELAAPGPALVSVPDHYRRAFPHNQLFHIRRGRMSAVVLAGGRSRFFTLRNGNAVVNAVRFASAFFGKGQFSAPVIEEAGNTFRMTQRLEAPYYQPLDPPERVNAGQWEAVRPKRKKSEICRLTQSVTISEHGTGFRLRIRSEGTKDVPLAVEINLREGGKLESVVPAQKVTEGWIFESGHAIYRAGPDAIRFGPGTRAHVYTQVRGAEPKLPGPSVYLTGTTPFDHTIAFECL